MDSAYRRSGGTLYGGASPRPTYRNGLSNRQVGAVGSDEIQLRIDPVHGDLDEEITGLRMQVRRLRNVAQEIDSEAKFQNDMHNQLQMTLIQTRAGVKNNVRRLNQSIVQCWLEQYHPRRGVYFSMLLHRVHVIQNVTKLRRKSFAV